MMLHQEQRDSFWQRLGRCYPLQIELVPLLMLGLMVYLILRNYSTLPDTIPTHFNAQGAADDWGSKGMLLLFPAISVPLYIFLTVFNAWISVVRDPKSLINLPSQTKAAISDASAERLRVFVVRSLLMMKTLTMGLMTYMVYATIEVARGEARTLGIAFYAILGAIVLCTVVMAGKSLSLALSGRK